MMRNIIKLEVWGTPHVPASSLNSVHHILYLDALKQAGSVEEHLAIAGFPGIIKHTKNGNYNWDLWSFD